MQRDYQCLVCTFKEFDNGQDGEIFINEIYQQARVMVKTTALKPVLFVNLLILQATLVLTYHITII